MGAKAVDHLVVLNTQSYIKFQMLFSYSSNRRCGQKENGKNWSNR